MSNNLASLTYISFACISYRRHELVTRVGMYASFASLAGAFGGKHSKSFF